jgi:3-hydroxyisobutyrate dehydrogenase-like beta-hydroxyacid dehydrogenase
MKIGFIGLGSMGRPMAARLVGAGHRVSVYNRSSGRSAELAAAGATVAPTPAAAARDAEAVFTMLADDMAVEAVVLGPEGLLAGLPAGAIHLSSSTISVALAERLDAAHQEAGSILVSAPVFGRPDAATAGRLFVVTGGPAAAVERCRPLFEAVGQHTFPVGDHPAAANLVKLTGNFLIAATIESLSEAFALVRKAGVDPHEFLDVLTGTLFTAPVHRTYGTLIAEDRFSPAGFPMGLGLKDVRLALAAAEAVRVPMPIASLVRDQLLSGLARGHGDLDWAALGLVAAENAGLG